MTPIELFDEACASVRKHHPVLKPFLSVGEDRQRAARHMVVEQLPPGRSVVGPDRDDRDLRILVRGSAVNVASVLGGHPETIRNIGAPATFNINSFALGQARRTTVLSTATFTSLRISPKSFRRMATDTPMVAVGLLRWAAMDLMEWITQHRMGTDAWSIRYGRRGCDERVFEPVSARREPVELDPVSRDVAAEGLRSVRCFQGQSLHPLADGLGTQVDLVTVAEGEPIVAHGELDGHVYLLLDGEAAIFGASGYELTHYRGGGGAQEVIIGEISFLAQGARYGTVTAVTDCLLLQIPRAAVMWMLRQHPVLAVRLHKALLRTLCWRMIDADEERDGLVSALAGTAIPASRR